MRGALWGILAVSALTVSACSDDRSGEAGGAGSAPPPLPATAAPATSAAVATTAAGAPEGSGDDEASPGLRIVTAGGPLELVVPPPEVVTAYGSYLRAGVDAAPAYVAAVGGTLEITSTRASYDALISTVATVGTRRVELPEGTVTDWSGLPEFFLLRIVDDTGDAVFEAATPFCPEAGNRIRISPDGPVESRPIGLCDLTPLGVGATWRLEQGWAVTTFPDLTEIGLDPGEYRIELSVTEPYLDLLSGPDRAEVELTVVTGDLVDYLYGTDQDLDGLDDAIDPDVDGDGVPDADDVGLDFVAGDADGDGVTDDVDDLVDTDGDGLDDRFGSGGLGIIPLTDDEFAEDAIGGVDTDGQATASAAPDHEGRPETGIRPPRAALPDLRSLPAFAISASYDLESERDLLSFSAITWNAGPATMVVDGFVRPGQPDVMDAYQTFGDAPGLTQRSAPIGTLEYHEGGGHDHWHFTDFARYQLLTEDGREVQRSGKESWCLVNTDAVDLRSAASRLVPEGSLSTSCGDRGSLWVRETLGIGWGDRYDQFRAGQAFDITDLPNGRYLLRIIANPEGSMYETDTDNNVADRLVIIGGSPGERTVEVPPVGLVDTEEIEFGSGNV